MKTGNFKDELKRKMDDYVHFIYRVTKNFPKDELYGVTSQIRRASLSIILNYIEGCARRKSAVKLNFLEISYGSLKSLNIYYIFLKKRIIFKKKIILLELNYQKRSELCFGQK